MNKLDEFEIVNHNDQITEPETVIYLPQRKYELTHQMHDVKTIIIKSQLQFKNLGDKKTNSYENSKAYIDTQIISTGCLKDDSSVEISKSQIRSYGNNLPQIQNAATLPPNQTGILCSSNIFMEKKVSDSSLCHEKGSLFNVENKLKDDQASSRLLERFNRLEKLYIKSEKIRRLMKTNHLKTVRALKTKVKQLESKISTLENAKECFTNIFDTDQLALLNKNYKKVPKWCENSLIKAYRLRTACGIAGYKELLRQEFPLPSLRTLRAKLMEMRAASGVTDNDEIFQLLDENDEN